MKLLFPDDVRHVLAPRYERQRHDWLAGDGTWPLVITLGDPTEKQVAQDVSLVRAWSDAWRAWSPTAEVHWEARHWPRLGQQHVPARLQLATPERVAELSADLLRHQLSQQRYARFAETWRALRSAQSWKRHLDTIADYADADYERMFQLITWLDRHPHSGYYLRQLPIAGIDTKWIDSKRQGLISALLQLIRGGASGTNFHAACGLQRPPHRIRVRLLCPQLRRAFNGIGDIEAPLDELATLDLAPARAIIVENLETGLALPELPGCVAFMKLGLGVSLLSRLRWLREPVEIYYWGDLDTHGFACLDRARSALPQVQCMLMDEATLLEHRNWWGRESQPYAGELTHLTATERRVFEGLLEHKWSHAVRLEQERISWECVLNQIRHLGGTSREHRSDNGARPCFDC